MPLTTLKCSGTRVTDLLSIKDLKLTTLELAGTKVSDLSPLKDMKLTRLFSNNSQVTDLTPLKNMPLKEFRGDYKPERDREILLSIKTLEKINDKPKKDFFK